MEWRWVRKPSSSAWRQLERSSQKTVWGSPWVAWCHRQLWWGLWLRSWRQTQPHHPHQPPVNVEIFADINLQECGVNDYAWYMMAGSAMLCIINAMLQCLEKVSCYFSSRFDIKALGLTKEFLFHCQTICWGNNDYWILERREDWTCVIGSQSF